MIKKKQLSLGFMNFDLFFKITVQNRTIFEKKTYKNVQTVHFFQKIKKRKNHTNRTFWLPCRVDQNTGYTRNIERIRIREWIRNTWYTGIKSCIISTYTLHCLNNPLYTLNCTVYTHQCVQLYNLKCA